MQATGRVPTVEEIERFTKKHRLNSVDAFVLKSATNTAVLEEQRELRLNILEAVAGDAKWRKSLSVDNAAVGYALIADVERRGRIGTTWVESSTAPEDVTHPNHMLEVDLPKAWVDLYISWNLDFVLGCDTDLDLLLAKLLIPSTLCSKPENYLELRAISLWLTLNFSLIRRQNKGSLAVVDVDQINLKKQLREKLAKINKDKAAKLLGIGVSELDQSFKEGFQSHSLSILMRAFGSYGINSNFTIAKNLMSK